MTSGGAMTVLGDDQELARVSASTESRRSPGTEEFRYEVARPPYAVGS